jgi:hypothetical protein
MKKFFIGIIILGVVLAVGLWIARGEENIGAVTNQQPMGEGTLFSGIQNVASVSSDAGDDTIIIENDPGATYASVSRGDVLRFDGTVLTEGVNYYVTVASLSDRFEVSLVPNGATVDLASSDGDNFFYQSGDSTTFNVEGLEYITISVDAEEVPSASLYFVGSIQNDGLMNGAPNFYASQSLSNRWDKIAVYNLQNNTEVEGDTGITLSATDAHDIYQVYTQNLKWISAIIDRYASGSLQIKIKGVE